MKIHKKAFVIWLFTIFLAGLGLGLDLWVVSANSATITGTVTDIDGPVTGAHVRVRATDNLTITNNTGNFILTGLESGQNVEVTAWADGYYIASKVVTPTANGIELILRQYHTTDHPDYDWLSPFEGDIGKACGNCHPMIISQWQNNAHGGAISNARFFSLYNGTNLSGTLQIAPGYLTDFPGTVGNCASCHAPGAAVDGFLATNMNTIRDIVTAGVHCDFCHKVGGVYLDPASGSVYPNAPGVESLRVLRPPVGEQIFLGPFDDIPDPDTYLPLAQESQFCAPCHQFSFWGTPIYESYNEWLASPYADEGITCQKCHMLPTGDAYFALPEVGGVPHPPDSIPSHLQPGASSLELLQDTVSMTLQTEQIGQQLWVTVLISNTNAGHHVPTDHPGRHLILTVTTADQDGHLLLQTNGDKVPDWGGLQAGLPGKTFAKVLRDVQTGGYPVVSYWKQTSILSDNRIPAFAADSSRYAFALPTDTALVTVQAELLFRRTYQAEMDLRGWQEADIPMEIITKQLPASAHVLFIPLVRR